MSSFGVKLTFNCLCDVIPVFTRRLTALSRSRLASVSCATRLTHQSTGRPMPKKEKAVKVPVAGSGAAAAGLPCSVAADGSSSVIISVHVKPSAKRSSITEVSDDSVGVSIAAPPADGEANAELVRYLAEVLQLKRSHISLDKGSRYRDKLIRVDSSLSPEEVLRRLRQAAG
ncbi:UPF0235 protein C15orf40 homolog [Antennarius striatus]|uniref:UPF0235 protein C15orf40 homolog n=1 Tax=Antennarius striatus TaxID=241820 RepID=UPI0035B11E90